MRVPNAIIGVKGDECQCGRRETVAHCPSCGSTRRYARANRMHKMIDGSERFVKTEFRCMTCGHEYIDEERALCEAPPIGTVLATQRVRAIHEARLSGETLTPKEAKIAKAIDTIVGVSNTPEQSAEAKAAAEKKLDYMIRSLWADEVFAFKEGKQDAHPGDINAYIERRKKEFLEQQ